MNEGMVLAPNSGHSVPAPKPTDSESHEAAGRGRKYLERVARWRQDCPDLVIRSTFIVGFPGETEAEFSGTAGLAQRGGAWIGSVASNSHRSMVPASQQVARPGARASQGRTLAAFHGNIRPAISAERLQRPPGPGRAGDRRSPGRASTAIARSYGDAPEIDGNVIVEQTGEVQVGDFIDVRMTGAE